MVAAELVPLAPSMPASCAEVSDETSEVNTELACFTVASEVLTFCVYSSTSPVSMVFSTIEAAAVGLSEG